MRRIGRIFRAVAAIKIVVIDFPEQLCSVQVEASEIVLAVRVVIGAEIAKGANPSQREMRKRYTKSACACREEYLSAAQRAAEGIVQFADADRVRKVGAH